MHASDRSPFHPALLTLPWVLLAFPAAGARPQEPSPTSAEARLADLVAQRLSHQKEVQDIQGKIREFEANAPPTLEQAAQDFMVRFHELLASESELPNVFPDRHENLLLKILRARRPALADRLEKRKLRGVSKMLFDECRKTGCEKVAERPTSAPVGDKQQACVDFVAMMQEKLLDAVDRAGEIEEFESDADCREEGLRKEAWGASTLEWMRGLGRDVDPISATKDILARRHPGTVEAFLANARQSRAMMEERIQVEAKAALTLVFMAQMFFREGDLDKNGIKDFWTGDVSGLHRHKVEGRPIDAMAASIAALDASPLGEDAVLAPPLRFALEVSPREAAKQDLVGAYALKAVALDEGGLGYAQDTDGSGKKWRHTSRYAVCAYPRAHGRGGRLTYLIDESFTGRSLWAKDTGGRPTDRRPRDLEADGWTQVPAVNPANFPIPALIHMANSTDGGLRKMARQAFWNMEQGARHPDVVRTLVSGLLGPDGGGFGDHSCFKTLRRLWHHFPESRKQVMELLHSGLTSLAAEGRVKAAEQLRFFADFDSGGVLLLCGAFKDPDARVRDQARRSLEQIVMVKMLPWTLRPFETVLKVQDPDVCPAVLDVLADGGPDVKRLIPAIKTLLASKDDRLRKAAQGALERIQSKPEEVPEKVQSKPDEKPAAAPASTEDDFFKFERRPKFSETSADPVLFRYKLKAGQVQKTFLEMDMNSTVSQGFQKVVIKQSMKIDAKVAVTGVDAEGNISAVVKITRFRMTASGQAEVDFDSDKADAPDENFKGLLAMVNVGIPCRMSPIGKLLETDLEPMRLAVRRAGNAALTKVLDDSTEKMFEGTFVELSEAPLKSGDTYKAGTIVNDQIKTHVSYQLLSVAAERKNAVLEVQAKLEIPKEAFGGADVNIKSEKVSGWIHFDLDKGYARESEVKVKMLMDVKAEGESASVDVRMAMKMTSTLD